VRPPVRQNLAAAQAPEDCGEIVGGPPEREVAEMPDLVARISGA
jgi:hypothetical protein